MEEKVKILRRELKEFKESAKQAQEIHEKTFDSLNKKFNLLFKIFYCKNDLIRNARRRKLNYSRKVPPTESLTGEYPIRHFDQPAYSHEDDIKKDSTLENSVNIVSTENLELPQCSSETTLGQTTNVEESDENISGADIRCFVLLNKNDVLNTKPSHNSDGDLRSDQAHHSPENDSRTDIKKSGNLKKEHQIVSGLDPLTLQENEFDRKVKALREEDNKLCSKLHAGKFPEPIPENYLKYAVTHRKTLVQIRRRFFTDRWNLKKKSKNSDLNLRVLGKAPSQTSENQSVSSNLRKNHLKRILRNKSIDALPITSRRTAPANMSQKHYEANFQALKKELVEFGKDHPASLSIGSAIGNYYLEHGASRGWTLKQVRRKYIHDRRATKKWKTEK